MTRLQKLLQAVNHPGYIPAYWRRLVREFTFFDLDYLVLNGYSFPPKSLCLILTERCNLKCVMCDIGQKNVCPSPEVTFPLVGTLTRGAETMTLADWRGVVDDLVNRGWQPLLLLTGTEPLLYPEVLELAEYILLKGLRLHLTTNGTLLARFAEGLVDLAKRPDSLTVTVSLDGVGETHDAIRGVPGTFDRALAGLEAVTARKRERGRAWPAVGVCYTISNYNYLHMGEFVEWLLHREIDLASVTFSHLWFRDETIVARHNDHYGDLFPVEQENLRGLALEAIDMDRVHAQLRTLRARSHHLPFAILEQPRLTLNEARTYYAMPSEPVFYEKCLAPWRNVSINPRGAVIISPLCFDYSPGNVKDSAFSVIWNGTSLRGFRNHLRQVGSYPACTRCCMLFDSKPKYYKLKDLL